MKEIKENKDLTYEEAVNDPSLAHIHDLIRYVQKTPFSKMFPKKHQMSLLSIVEMDTRKLFIENPNLQIKTVVTKILQPLTEDIPAPLVLKLTKKIIQKWENLSATLPQNNEVLTSV